MSDYQMGPIESRFADLIWENEPINSAELAKRGEELFLWKKSTTYTVLKRLCDKGIFQKLYSVQSERFVEENFNGSLPAFIAAFTAKRALTPNEVAELRRMVDEYGEG